MLGLGLGYICQRSIIDLFFQGWMFGYLGVYLLLYLVLYFVGSFHFHNNIRL